MIHVDATNVNDAIYEGCRSLLLSHSVQDSRNGRVRVHRGPFVSSYRTPVQRVLFDAERDANPFFHLIEALWMFAGRDDVISLSGFNSQISQYSDDGVVFRGAYGRRWRSFFDHDQITWSINRLRDDCNDRRVVLQMFDAKHDHTQADLNGRDIPCNLSATLQVHDCTLDMMVSNRSNDLIWGTYGANVVHFSMLQELLASAIGVPVGQYHQVSANTHVYERHWPLMESLAEKAPDFSRRTPSYPAIIPLVESDGDWHDFLDDCRVLFTDIFGFHAFKTYFFNQIVTPMIAAFSLHRNMGRTNAAIDSLAEGSNADADWLLAGRQWLERRVK